MVDDTKALNSGESPKDTAEQGQLTDKELDKAAGGASMLEYGVNLSLIVADPPPPPPPPSK